MEYLKEVFGDSALTYEQFSEKVGANEKIKLANLADGGYVGKDKYAALETKYNTTADQLTVANQKLEGYDPEWKTKAKRAAEDADERVNQVKFDYALNAALRDAKARNVTAVRALLNMEGLKFADGTVVGLKEQLESIKAENDYLFENDAPPAPRFTASAQGVHSGAADKKSQFNDVLRSALGGKDVN